MAKKHYKSVFSFIAGYQAPIKRKKLSPPTEAQLIQQDKFRMVVSFTNHIKEVISIGFSREKLGNMSIRNFITKDILTRTMVGEYPDCRIDYSRVHLSTGYLEYILMYYSAINSKGILRLIWEMDDLEDDGSEKDDQVCVFVYNETKDKSYNFINAAQRADLELNLQIPSYDRGDMVHCWVFLQSKDGKMLSDSSYYGDLDDLCG